MGLKCWPFFAGLYVICCSCRPVKPLRRANHFLFLHITEDTKQVRVTCNDTCVWCAIACIPSLRAGSWSGGGGCSMLRLGEGLHGNSEHVFCFLFGIRGSLTFLRIPLHASSAAQRRRAPAAPREAAAQLLAGRSLQTEAPYIPTWDLPIHSVVTMVCGLRKMQKNCQNMPGASKYELACSGVGTLQEGSRCLKATLCLGW